MIYQQRYFQLDTESRKVFDENGKELRITGNAFRLLAFLCENKNATITKIGECLDYAKNYDENHIRQYKYKINSIIGRDIIEYKNAIYSVAGDVVKEAGKIEKRGRNTDLLRSDSLIWGIVKNISKKPAIIASILLALAVFPWVYGYYIILRWAVSLVAIYYILGFYSRTKIFDFKIWTLVATAVLFNPLAPIFLHSKIIWGIIDISVAGFFVYLIINLKKYEK